MERVTARSRNIRTWLRACTIALAAPYLAHASTQNGETDPASASDESVHGMERLPIQFPDGSVSHFSLADSQTIPAALQARYPSIRSMKGKDPLGRQIRIDFSPKRIRGVVSDGGYDWWIDQPRSETPVVLRPVRRLNEETPASPSPARRHPWSTPGPTASSTWRIFRIAVATTGGYSAEFGNDKTESLASVAATINQVNMIYERDLGIHFVLADDNDKLIIAGDMHDPYKETDQPRDVAQHLIGETIGNQNFDLGHLFEASSAGGATPAVCEDDEKADAASGMINTPDGPPLWDSTFVALVAHEIGHQFGANHSHNGCTNDSELRVEPGSGSTLMAYPGDCYFLEKWPPEFNKRHTLQDYRDAYFHAASITQIKSKLAALTCGRRATATPQPLQIDTRKPPFTTPSLTIPAHTPFALTANVLAAPPGALLTYAWEQVDHGGVLPDDLAPYDDGTSAIFRSLPLSKDATRVFPRLETILGKQPPLKGETLPTTQRDLNFAFVVRNHDPQASNTAIAYAKLKVFDTGHAFAVTAPKEGVVARANRNMSIRWNVAGTDNKAIACRAINVDLSLDGGQQYLTKPIASRLPNTGTATIKLPAMLKATSQARLRLSCANNVFFAVSPGDFVIRP